MSDGKMSCEELESNFFEGTEKLLEVWFTRKDGEMGDCDLRDIPRQKLDSLLKMVHCEVISFSQNDEIDAYVLSESSMFVNKRRFILKTCGTTTPLHCVKPLLYLVDQFTAFDEVQDVYYSRKNYAKPELQKQPHTCFEEETKMLEKLFPGGAPYCMGRVNRDCWYLYTTNAMGFGKAKPRAAIVEGDQTLEVLMTDLDPQVMSVFTKEVCSTAQEATQLTGIDKFLPNVYIDDYLFDPCGYSMNGIMKTGHYMTIHITPESNCSYVSFETNYPMESYHDLITRVVNAFNPGKFIVTAFVNKVPQATRGQELFYEQRFGKYSCLDMQLCKFKNYDLTYALFAKFPS